jgi:hypothetical protein
MNSAFHATLYAVYGHRMLFSATTILTQYVIVFVRIPSMQVVQSRVSSHVVNIMSNNSCRAFLAACRGINRAP